MLLAASGAWAISDITTWDKMGSGTSGWVRANSAGDPIAEDNEVEPNCQTGQAWDLEAFVVNDAGQNTRFLTIVGGWDFRSSLQGWHSGDVFLAVNPSAVPLYGPAADAVPVTTVGGVRYAESNFGYQYALDINWGSTTATTFTYDVISLPSTAKLEMASVYYTQNEGSNPYRYNSGGTDIGDGSATYKSFANDAALNSYLVGLGGNAITSPTGGSHYALTFNLDNASWLGTVAPGDHLDFWAHFTQECGNDDLMGHGDLYAPPVPEPISMVMLSCLGAGMLGTRKIRQWRKSGR